jgi:hypothetical protein
MGGGKKQTIGYKYYFSLHMGLGRGPINEIAEIRVGDITAYGVPIDLKNTGQLIAINRPDLFGGEKKEGGIQGPCYVYNGAEDQVLQGALGSSLGTLPSIAAQLGGDVPNFRGVVTLWFDGLVAAMNPYPKEWSFRVRRYDAGWFNDDPWYPGKARVVLQSENGGSIHAMNGAHMLYEINTNPEWGRGMPADLIDEDSYVAAANQLCAEKLGLCIPWFRQESIKDFIPVIINHIGGVQYVDRETGKMTLRLIRGDYDPDDLPLFTPDTGLIDVIDDDASGEETSYNEIVIKGFDPTTKEDIMVRVHNLAAIQSQGEIISNTIEYRGLATRELCGRVALRELKVQLPLRKMNVILDRRGWRIAPGMPYRISHPAKGINNMILRAGEARDGTLTDGKITIKSVQDIFGMPETSYITPPGSGWTPPTFTALPPPESQLYEMNWRDFYLRSTTADQDSVDEGTSFVALVAKDPPNTQTQGYDVLTKPDGGTYTTYSTVGFTGWLTLLADIAPLDTSFEVEDENVAQFVTEFVAGMVVLVDDEQMEFTAFNDITRLATVKRGVADTIPAAHTAGATIWLIDDELGADGQEYQDGETVYGKALTRTSTDLLDESAATEVSVEVNQRVFRPYPPGDVKVAGTSIYALEGIYEDPALTWTHRNRLTQGDVPVGHTEASTGPEAGVTYNIRVYDADEITLLRETDVGAVDTWTYDDTMQTADGGPAEVWIELESKRDDVASHFLYRFNLVITGTARLTEDGDVRLTEDGEIRVLEV